MSAVLAIARADVAERVRRFSFIITIAAALWAGYSYVPGVNSAYHTIVINGHTGVYNSAFYGAMIAALTGGFLALVGFFLVRGAVEREIECHIDGIVGASPVRKSTFVISKWLSNAAVLWAVGGVSYLAAMGMQALRGSALQVQPLEYLVPYLLITVPAMAFVAAIATAFDLVPFLRGILGAVAFIVLWPTMLAATDATALRFYDPLGFTALSSSLIAAERHAFPSHTLPEVSFGIIVTKHLGGPFVFNGFTWTGAILEQRIVWLAIAIGLVLLASLLFDRFRRDTLRKRGSRFIDVGRLLPNVPSLRILRAEFSLIANGAAMWWYLGAAGIIGAGIFVPLEDVTKVVLPLALIWPLERMSALGARERRFGVEDIVTSTAQGGAKILLSQWAAGALLAFILCSTCVLRLTLAGDPAGIMACAALVASISALALALGIIYGASRPFVALFLIAWYLGPVQHLTVIDFASGLLTAPVVMSVVCSLIAVAAISVARVRRSVR